MNLNPSARRSFLSGSLLLALAVMLGAFGAHGLKNLVTPEKLVTFETGIRYHFYHGFGLLFLALTQQQFPHLNFKLSFYSFMIGTLLFSFNCYFYVVSGLKIFAMIVPLGGTLFILGWMAYFWRMLKFGK